MQLTIEQLNAAEQGDAVRIEADGKTFVLLSDGLAECETEAVILRRSLGLESASI
jgi:hypothetical protein